MKRTFDRVKASIFIGVGIVNICLFLFLCYRWYLTDTIDTPPMTRSDYLDLSLTLLEVLLGTVTIFLAIAAFFAYYDVRRAAERMAEQTTMEVFQKLSNGEQPFPGASWVIANRESVSTSAPQTTRRTGTPDPDEALGPEITKEEETEE